MLNARYSWKKYIIFLAAYVLFLIVSIVQLKDRHPETGDNCLFLLCAYIYGPLVVTIACSTIEMAKCNYLIPRTPSERKQMIVMQNMIKMVVGLVLSFGFFWVSIWINPRMFQISLLMCFMSGVPMTFMLAVGGMDIYYKEGDKKKKRSNAYYYLVTAGSLMFGFSFVSISMILSEAGFELVWVIVDILLCIASFLYFIYYYYRFSKLDAIYDNINFHHIRLYKQGNFYVS